MSYDDHRAALDQLVHCALDQPLGAGVDARRRLIEHYHARVAEEDTGERQELRLSRGHARTLGAKQGVEAFRQVRVPGAQAELLDDLDHPAVGDGVVEQRQVVPHRSLEESHVLGHDADLPAQLRGAGVSDVPPAQQHAASVGVVEAEEQPCYRRLAAAGASHQPEGAARRKLEGDVMQHRLTGIVGERYAVEPHGQRPLRKAYARPV